MHQLGITQRFFPQARCFLPAACGCRGLQVAVLVLAVAFAEGILQQMW